MSRTEIANIIINAFVAMGTMAMAVVGVITIRKTQKSINATELSANATLRSAQATEMSIERMKDSLMPYLDLNIKWDNNLILSIRNVGSGLGRIHLVTVREDLSFDAVYQPTKYWKHIPPPFENDKGQIRIINYILGSKEECAFQLEKRTDTFNPGNQRWLSSLSVYYEDVYGRIFRSRILFTWDSPESIQVISKEHFTESVLPINELSSAFTVMDFYRIEGLRPVLYLPQFLKFHMLTSQRALIGISIPGTHFTHQKSFQIREIQFNLNTNGNPEFNVQVGNSRPFIISSNSNDGSIPPKITDPMDSETHPYLEYGLVPDGNDSPKKVELYNLLIKTPIKI